jgi:hypothetical protein
MEDSYQVERRSTRIRAQIPLRLTSLDAADSFSESCHTLVVNTEGCGVRLSRPMEPGAAVRLDELPSGSVMDGRVANCVPLGPKHWLVGIQLEETGNILGIHPAPADWTTEPEAVIAAQPALSVATKKGEWPFTQFSKHGEFHPGRK